MPVSNPFLTSYDPPRTSQGTLDPLGLYQIGADLTSDLVFASVPAESRVDVGVSAAMMGYRAGSDAGTPPGDR
jgi:hypothetical protein